MDIGVSAFISPSTSCKLDTNQQITVQITNHNTLDIVDFLVSFEYNGQVYSDSINFIVPAGDSIYFTFSHTINASYTGLYSLIAYTSHSLDFNNFNDTSSTSFTNYYHDFYLSLIHI